MNDIVFDKICNQLTTVSFHFDFECEQDRHYWAYVWVTVGLRLDCGWITDVIRMYYDWIAVGLRMYYRCITGVLRMYYSW